MSDNSDIPERGKIDAAAAAGQPAPSAADNVTPIFLLSAPRSGSAWLRDLMAEHAAIASGPETYAFEALAWFLAAVEERKRTDEGLLGAGYIDRIALGAACARLYRTAIASHVGGRAYFLEKTPLNTDFIDAIDFAFPEAKVLHLIRDGRDVSCSMMAARRERRMKLPGDVRGAALRWRRIERVIRFGRDQPDRYCEIRYEALLANVGSELERIFGFLAIPLAGSVLERMCEKSRVHRHPSEATASEGFVGKWRKRFSADDVRTFKEAAGKLLIDLGYERDDRW